MRTRILLGAGAAFVLLAGGLVAAWFLVVNPSRPSGALETALTDVTVTRTKPVRRHKPRKPTIAVDTPCWNEFGGDPRRSLARVGIKLGVPTKPLWTRGMGGYIEYPPSYCDGMLYVNTYRGTTFAVDARTGRTLWSRQGTGPKPSTPAIAGDRLIVSSTSGAVVALDRQTGRTLWQIRTSAKVESSPVAVDGVVYFGATDGRLYAVSTATGRIRWAYDTGGRINASPSIWANRLCITTYAGSIFCLDRRNGRQLWHTYVKRDFVRYESFYASPSTDGRRIFTVARSGKVVALRASDGHVLWTHDLNTLGYSTPAVANGRVFVGDFAGSLHAYRTATGRELWRRWVGGRILGGAVVIGNLVFFSTLETETYAARVTDGKIVWHLPIGKYSPAIATSSHYYFSLNGILAAYRGQNSPPEPKVTPAAGGAGAKRAKGGRPGSSRSTP